MPMFVSIGEPKYYMTYLKVMKSGGSFAPSISLLKYLAHLIDDFEFLCT